MIMAAAHAADQIQKGLNNRSQWCCHCLLFWWERCDELEDVPRSLTYRLIYSSLAHLPSHPTAHDSIWEMEGWEEAVTLREGGDDTIHAKIRQKERFSAEWLWANWGEGCLALPQLVEDDFETVTVMWAKVKETKIQEGANGLMMRRRRREMGRKQIPVIISNRVIMLWCVCRVHDVLLSFMTFSERTAAVVECN